MLGKKKKDDLKTTLGPKVREHLIKQGYRDKNVEKAMNNVTFIKQLDGQVWVDMGNEKLVCPLGRCITNHKNSNLNAMEKHMQFLMLLVMLYPGRTATSTLLAVKKNNKMKNRK